MVHLYKRKGNSQACDNHRGISLLCIAGKVLARILLNRLIEHLENGLFPESQCGFRKERGTIDMVFTARLLQEKCQEQNVDLYTTWWKPLIPSAAMASGASWVSLDALTDSSRWSVSSMTACRLKSLTTESHQLPSEKRSETKLCAGSNTVQHDAHCHADRCLPGLRPRHQHQIQNRRQAVQFATPSGQDQGPLWQAPWLPVHWWLSPQCQ